MRTLGKYELLEEVGHGGMSVVYRGRDTVLGREVAIKVMHPFMAHKSDAKERFCREAMAVAKLSHPNILEIYDYSGVDAEQAYIVMEFIRGETLSSFATRVPTQLPEIALLVIRALAMALAHAHDQGIIHRDLKPENVMIRGDGRLKLMDFGIAQMVDADTLTTTGALIGSPAHMPPELIEGETCDVRSDIFSVGTILYWLMTRRLPFTAPTAPALFKRIVDGAFDDPRIHNPLVTSGMLRVLNKLMKKKRDERYPNVRAFITDIDSELQKSGIDYPEEDLRRFLAATETYPAELKARLRKALIAQGDAAADAGQWGPALEAYDRLLALAPDDLVLREKVLAIGQRQRRQRRIKQVLRAAKLSTGALALSLLLSFIGWRTHVALRAEAPIDLGTLVSPASKPVFFAQHLSAQKSITSSDAARPRARDDGAGREARAVDRQVEIVLPTFGSLFVDGQLVGTDLQGPIARTMASGRHRIRVENPFMEALEREVELPAAGDIPAIVMKLERYKSAQLRVLTKPGAQVTLDGEVRGPATERPFSVVMTRGSRPVELRLAVPGRPDVVASVTVKAGQVTEHDAR